MASSREFSGWMPSLAVRREWSLLNRDAAVCRIVNSFSLDPSFRRSPESVTGPIPADALAPVARPPCSLSLSFVVFTALDLFKELRDKAVAPIQKLAEENHADSVRTAYDTRALT